MKDWKKIFGTEAEKPLEIDTTSSPTTVYQRKNIKQIVKKIGNIDIVGWEREERELSLEEYQQMLISLEILNENKQNLEKPTIMKNVVLCAIDWVGESAPYAYQLNLQEVTKNNIIEILPEINLTMEQYKTMTESGLIGGEQADGIINLLAYGNKPTIDLPIRILIR